MIAETVAVWTNATLGIVLRVALIVLVALVLVRLLRLVTQRLVQFASSEARAAVLREEQTRTLAGILYSAGTAVILVGAVLTALAEFGLNVTPFAAAAGLASLALGFGAQHLVRDLINGFFIVFEDQYVVGETVQAGGVTGRVEHLTLRRTVIRDDRGALCTIPNGEIRQVSNLSRDWSQIFVDVTLGNEAEIERALTVLENSATQMRVDTTWAPALVEGPRVLGVETLGAAGATVRLQVRTLPGRQHDVARELRRRVKAGFDQEKIPAASVQYVEHIGSTG